jgi:hypothetical protein
MWSEADVAEGSGGHFPVEELNIWGFAKGQEKKANEQEKKERLRTHQAIFCRLGLKPRSHATMLQVEQLCQKW